MTKAKRVKEGSPTTAVAYIRVSKDSQKLGPDAQRAMVEAWASSQGVAVVAWHEDLGKCGELDVTERPGLMAALADVRKHRAGILVCAKRDRIGRDMGVTAIVEMSTRRLGAKVVAASGEGTGASPMEALVNGTMHDLFAAIELIKIRERTRAALAVKRTRGEKTGGLVPYGYGLDVDGVHLVRVEREQAVITRARELRARGLSFGKVAKALASEGRLSRTGRAFADMQISRMTSGA